MEVRVPFEGLQDKKYARVALAGYIVEINIPPLKAGVVVHSPHQPFCEELQVQPGGTFHYSDPYVTITGRDDVYRGEVVIELEKRVALYKQDPVILLLAP